MIRPALRLLPALLLLYGVAPGAAAACPDNEDARAALDKLRLEMVALYRETSGIEQGLEKALAERARRSGWDETQTESFRQRLLQDPEYVAMEAQRLAEMPRIAATTARVVSASAVSSSAVLCSELPAMRFANQRLRTLLALEYEWLDRRIWGP